MSLDKEFTASWPKMPEAGRLALWSSLNEDQQAELWRRYPGLCPQSPIQASSEVEEPEAVELPSDDAFELAWANRPRRVKAEGVKAAAVRDAEARTRLDTEVAWLRSEIARAQAERPAYRPPPAPPRPRVQSEWAGFWRNCFITAAGVWLMVTLLLRCAP